MIIHLRAPRGCGPGGEGFHRKIDLQFVPRKDEGMNIDGSWYRVHLVDWYPFGDDATTEPYVYVVLRDPLHT